MLHSKLQAPSHPCAFSRVHVGQRYHQNGVTHSRGTAAHCRAPSRRKRRGAPDTPGPHDGARGCWGSRASWEASVGQEHLEPAECGERELLKTAARL